MHSVKQSIARQLSHTSKVQGQICYLSMGRHLFSR